jgi:HEAT repeat protein
MNRRWLHFGATTMTVLAVVAWISIEARRQPLRAGKTVGQWFQELLSPDQKRQVTALQALTSFGDQAHPFLRRALMRRDSRLKKLLKTLGSWYSLFTVHWIPAAQWREAALSAAARQGRRAAPLLPDLLQSFYDTREPVDPIRFELAFVAIGPDAVPSLVQSLACSQTQSRRWSRPAEFVLLRALAKLIQIHGLSETQFQNLFAVTLARLRYPQDPLEAVAAIQLVGQLGRKAEPAVDALVALATHQDPGVREEAVRTLGVLSLQPTRSVPALTLALDDNAGRVRIAALKSLANFGDAARSAVPAMTKQLALPSAALALATLNAFSKLGPAAASAESPILSSLSHSEATVRATAAAALAEVASSPRRAVPALIGLLQDETIEVRCRASTTLGKFGPAAAPAVDALVATLSDNREPVQISIVETLGNIGPAARAAIPKLYAAWNNNQSALGPYVKAALQKIDPPLERFPGLFLVGITGSPARSDDRIGWFSRANSGEASPRTRKALGVGRSLSGVGSWEHQNSKP